MLNHPRFKQWAAGFGAISHSSATQRWALETFSPLCGQGVDADALLELLIATDRVANAAMWLVAHMTYANRVRQGGEPLTSEDFKINPQGHTGGSLNMIPAYVGYMLANAVSGVTRSWIMGQGHAVAAIDATNLLLDNMRPEHAQRYSVTEAGLTRFVHDFYSYQLDQTGHQDSPLGSHINVNTAGGVLEGGYLGFADLHYVHMPLPGERLVAFLSDGAFEEQRGSDWAPRWWRAEDTGLVVPIMIFNGRRIDQRATMSQGKGLEWFKNHLSVYSFDPFDFDGTDPAAFACMILMGERLLSERAKDQKYPVLMPYGIAVAKKGAGFYGAGTNDAHGLPLGKNPRTDITAMQHFNESARRLFVPPDELESARWVLQNHIAVHRPRERDHPIANRDVHIKTFPEVAFVDVTGTGFNPRNYSQHCPMDAIDHTFLALVKANPQLRVRVGNPDEIRSNRMDATLDHLKHRVTEVEPGIAEAIDGRVITALNEEAVICACLGNKAGINLAVTYEAFGPKMLGALRQEIIWSEHLFSRGRETGWISVPVILTSNTYENGKNERSHQDTTMCEALMNEPADVSRVIFPTDYNSAAAALDACYRTRGRIFTFVVPKSATIPTLFTKTEAQHLINHGGITFAHEHADAQIILTAIGAFQMIETLRAAERLEQRGLRVRVNYLIEPGRFRTPRGRREAAFCVSDELRQQLFPEQIVNRVFASHTHPETMTGVLRLLDTGRKSIFLGYTNHGGTLDTAGMLFVNRLSWAHILRAAARSLEFDLKQVLDVDEIAALEGRRSPQGVLFA